MLHCCCSSRQAADWNLPNQKHKPGQQGPSALACSASQPHCWRHLFNSRVGSTGKENSGKRSQEDCFCVLWCGTKRGNKSKEKKKDFASEPKILGRKDFKNTLSYWLIKSWKNSSQPQEIIQIPWGDVRCEQRDIPSAPFLETQCFLDRCLVFPGY